MTTPESSTAAAELLPAPALQAGDRVGPYRLIEHIGAGGMGDVWRAVDTGLEREVALKTLRPELGSRADLVDRFRIEAIALARLHHRHIAAVYACVADGGRQHMAQQYVRGRTLESLLRERIRLPWREAVAIARDLLSALDHAHGLGVVHRDLKPANVMIDEAGRAVVLDFGIARIASRQRQTRSGCLVGTLHYLAPELIRGGEADARSDLYAVATLLHEMIDGRVPFDADSDYALMKAVLETPPPMLRNPPINPPAALADLIARGLAKKPGDRPADARSFDAELAAILASCGVPDAEATDRLAVPASRTVIAAERLSANANGRFWTVLDLPTSANGQAWWIWSRRNPGLAAGLMALGVAVAAWGWPPPPSRFTADPIATAAANPIEPRATALAPLGSNAPASPTTPPPSAPEPRAPEVAMPLTPLPTLRIDPGSRRGDATAEASVDTGKEGRAEAGGSRTSAPTQAPRASARGIATAGDTVARPPTPNEGQQGWYVRR